MQIFTQLITFGASPVAPNIQDAEGNRITRCTRFYVEPASGTHVSFVEKAGTASGAGDTTAGVVKRLAAYSSTGILDNFFFESLRDVNDIDLTQWQFDGTAGEEIKLSVFVE